MVLGSDPTLERHAKELLYRCLEEIGATKAALYLAGDDGSFRLTASYGFGRRDTVAAEVKDGHPLYDWVRRHRTKCAFLNEPLDNASLGQVLEAAGTARLLTIPLTVGDRLVGFVDARDKARRRPYSPEDLEMAASIAESLQAMIQEHGLFGPPTPTRNTATASLRTTVEPPSTHLHSSCVEELSSLLRELGRLPSIGGIAVTLTEDGTVRTVVLHGYPLEQNEREALARHQVQLLESRGVKVPPPSRWAWSEEPSGSKERRREEIHSAIVLDGPPTWIVLSVLTPEASLAGDVVLTSATHHLEQAIALRDYRRAARNALRALLEPGESSYPHLRQHSQTVSELAQRMAALLRLSEPEEELITIAGYLHDVGMRELDYNRLYRAERPGEAEKRIYQRHPTVGARIVDGVAFPGDLAAAIRHHHERWDGGGYPQRLSGQAIPQASRIIHLSEVFDILTSSASYKRPITANKAIDAIRSEAGKQFDPGLVDVLEEAVRS